MTSLPAAIAEARRTGDDQTADWLEELERLRAERIRADQMFELGWSARDNWHLPAGPDRERYYKEMKAEAFRHQPKENEDDG